MTLSVVDKHFSFLVINIGFKTSFHFFKFFFSVLCQRFKPLLISNFKFFFNFVIWSTFLYQYRVGKLTNQFKIVMNESRQILLLFLCIIAFITVDHVQSYSSLPSNWTRILHQIANFIKFSGLLKWIICPPSILVTLNIWLRNLVFRVRLWSRIRKVVSHISYII